LITPETTPPSIPTTPATPPKGRVCCIVFGIKITDLVGPLAGFMAIEFNKTEVRQLLTTINNAAKEAALTERSLDVAFEKWWPDLEQKVQAISSAQPTTAVTHRNAEDLLEEVVENTRAIIRELQALPPWQRFSMSPQMEAMYQALLREQQPLRRILELPDEPPPGGIPSDGTVAKSE
jgi:hypothetical protein